MADRTLTVRGVADAVLERLRSRATSNRRSLNGELLAILDRAAADTDPAPHSLHTPHASHGTVREPTSVPYGDAAQATGVPYGDAATTAAASLAHIDRDALEDICRRHHIVWLAVFGSFVRGDARPDSDVDVVVDFVPGMTPGFGIVRVADALRPVMGGRRVDLVTRRGLSSRLRDAILTSAKTLYAAE